MIFVLFVQELHDLSTHFRSFREQSVNLMVLYMYKKFMTILYNEEIWCASGEMNTLPNKVLSMFKPITQECMYVILSGTTNRERRGVSEADTTYVDPSVGVYKENSDATWFICTNSLTRSLYYDVHVPRYILLSNIWKECARQCLQHMTFY